MMTPHTHRPNLETDSSPQRDREIENDNDHGNRNVADLPAVFF